MTEGQSDRGEFGTKGQSDRGVIATERQSDRATEGLSIAMVLKEIWDMETQFKRSVVG